MTRRDTILIAVLLNTVLLAVLFLMAVNTEDDVLIHEERIVEKMMEAPQALPKPIQPLPVAIKEPVADQTERYVADSLEPQQHKVVFKEIQPEKPRYQEDFFEEVVVREAKKPAPKPEPSPKTVEITVKRGDFLEKIARANGTTVEAIKKANGLTSERIAIGQVLVIPLNPGKESVSKKEVAKDKGFEPMPTGGEEYYTIQSGDNPWKLAKKFHVRFEDIVSLNHLDEKKARNLQPGDRIRVR